MELKTLALALVAACLLAGGCADDTKLSTDENRNFSEGMSAEKVKEIGPAPAPPSGPQEGYKDGSAADKAQGR